MVIFDNASTNLHQFDPNLQQYMINMNSTHATYFEKQSQAKKT